MVKQAKRISKAKADQIIKESIGVDRRVVCVWHGQWYDLRQLSDPEEVNEFIYWLTGINPTPLNTLNINLKK